MTQSSLEYHLPEARNKLPELKTDFGADMAAKGAFVGEVIQISTKAMTDADASYNQFMYLEAEAEYIVSLDGFIHLMKITKDDANFQSFLTLKMTYLLDRAEKCKKFIKTTLTDKKAAGFYNVNDQPDTIA